MTDDEKQALVTTAMQLGEAKVSAALARMSPEQRAAMMEVLQQAPEFAAKVTHVVANRLKQDTKNLPRLAEETIKWAARIGDLFDDE